MRGPPTERDIDSLCSFGVVNLDKPPGPSAHQVTAWLRDRLGVDRAAHAGTLDPKVTGCLPVLTGDATRMAQVFDDSIKAYVAVLELHGQADDLSALEAFEGEIYQKPPRKSAVARRLRTRTIHRLELLERDGRSALCYVECQSGTYIRKLCHDLGLAIGTGAHMGDLRRVQTGTFDDTDLNTMEDLTDAVAFAAEGEEETIREVIQPAERALVGLGSVTIAPSAAEEVANGAPLYAPGIIETDGVERDALVACYTPDGAAVSIGTLVGDPDGTSGLVVDTERVLV
ncbi:RNA-guided pseudouridylation complex pseudouridine synthase subunit Cbf5 [Halocatena halophila]|uniref:RNA-guided pseudouridylation complex pseudouridine synthase subunit Cbf5 n=1 Tax=Halocatena halophila TaxID=2814576 RepID=UPI002ED10BED